MALIQKTKLLVDYNQYKEFNGFVEPIITSEDIENGLDTVAKKYEAWSRYTQVILNAILQEELDNIGYDITKVKTAYQHSLINIISMRLIRAFHNDELIPRDSQVQISQQGGLQYSSSASLDSKSSLYSFFDGRERALIESSGLTTDIFAWDTEDEDDIPTPGDFKDGVRAEDVAWSDKLDRVITIGGVNTTIDAVIKILNDGALFTNDLPKEVEKVYGFKVNGSKVTSTKPIVYDTFIASKEDNELAQMKDVKDAEARTKTATDSMIKKMNNVNAELEKVKEDVDLINNLELLQSTLDLTDHVTSFDASNISTVDLKTIMVDDPDNAGSTIRLFPDKLFVDGAYVTVELADPVLNGGTAITQSFIMPRQSIYDMGDYTVSVSLTNQGILTLTNTTPGKDVSNLIVSAVSISGGQVTGLETAALEAIIKKKTSKQLNQGAAADFETYVELKALLLDSDFTSISLANGDLITGRVSNIDDANITISGIYLEHGTTKTQIGNVKLDKSGDSFTVSFEASVYTKEKLDTFLDDWFNVERDTARNEAVNIPQAIPTNNNVKTVYQLKNGLNNDYADKLHKLQIKIFDVDNKAVYTTSYDDLNPLDYNTDILIKMLKNGVLTNYSINLYDALFEGQPENEVYVVEGDKGTGTIPPTFKYEVYIIDRQPSIANTHAAAAAVDSKTPTGRLVNSFGMNIIQLSSLTFASMKLNDEVLVSFDSVVRSIAGGADAIPAAAMLYIGDSIAIKQTKLGSNVKTNVMWETKTNPTDTNIKDHWETSLMKIKKVSDTEFDFLSWESNPKFLYLTLDGKNYRAPKGVPDGSTLTLRNGKWHWIKFSHEFTRETKAELDAIPAADISEGDIGFASNEDKFYHYHVKTNPVDPKETGWELHVDSGGSGGTPGGTEVLYPVNVKEFLQGKDGVPVRDGPSTRIKTTLGGGFTGEVTIAPVANKLNLGLGAGTEEVQIFGKTIHLSPEQTISITLPLDFIGAGFSGYTIKKQDDGNDYELRENGGNNDKISFKDLIAAVKWWKDNHGGGA